MRLRPPATPLRRPRLLVEELDPRILYSADAAALLGLAASPGAEVREVAPPAAPPAAPEPQQASAVQQQGTREIVFIDSRVPDALALADQLMQQRGTDRAFDIVMLDANEDGIAQIDRVLATEHGLSAVHLISHGSAGAIQIGSTTLDEATLAREHDAVARWGAALGADGDLLLYGCNVAAGATGTLFLHDLAALTGADVAASTDLTGSAAAGGNWTLEATTGRIQTQLTADRFAALQWQGVLASYVVTTNADSGAGSLRQAIIDANASAGADSITFSGVGTINLASLLPQITGQLSIDGTSAGGTPGVTINGGGAVTIGLQFNSGSDGSTVRGLVVQNFSSRGLFVQGAANVTIAGNYIGTDSGGNVGAANAIGIDLFNAANAVIGGTNAADRNVISGNSNIGVNIVGAGSAGTVVQGNYIGTNVAGSADLGNTNHGIYVNGVSGVTIGGSAAGAGNVVSGQNFSGITLDSGTSGVSVQGNLVGLSANGTGTIANSSYGIWVLGSGNSIGGTVAGARNVISGNGLVGIRLSGTSATGNTIAGNYVGTGTGGITDLGNAQDGIRLDTGASNNTIGGTIAGARNTIGGNDSSGIALNDAATSGNTILGNWIGAGANGSTQVANGLHGININAATGTLIGDGSVGGRNVIAGNTQRGINIANASGTQVLGNWLVYNGWDGISLAGATPSTVIGGLTGTTGNLIAHNGFDGILLWDASTTASILANSVYANGERGIDLANNGYDTNDVGDADTGPNGYQNYPVLSSVSAGTAGTTVAGTLNSSANTTFRIDVYANRPGDVDGSHGEGARWVGSLTVTTDGSGNASFNSLLANAWINQGDIVTATATVDLGGGSYGATSEFAANITGTASGVVVVDTASETYDAGVASGAVTIATLGNNRGGDGRISLREAVYAVNNSANGAAPDRIVFAIAPNIESLNYNTAALAPTITLSSALADITQAATIDASTQPGAGAAPQVQLRGNGAVANGLTLAAGSSGSTVRGFIVGNFTANGINITGGNSHTIAGIWVGLARDGLTADANGGHGINLSNSTGTTIGGTNAVDRNVISGNAAGNLYLNNAINSVVYGNYIGTDATGLLDPDGQAYASGRSGVYIDGASTGNQIGNTVAGARNLISGNNWVGVDIISASATGNTISGNFIGTDATGLAALSNAAGVGYWGAGAGNRTVANVISGNAGVGVGVGNASTGAVIQGNTIGLGVDGSTLVGNGSQGIVVHNGSTNTLIGTNADGNNDAAEGNVIAGNLTGVWVTANGTTGTVIQGNLIGTDASGMLDRGNSGDGIRVDNGAGNVTIGGTSAVQRNVVSGNDGIGIVANGSNIAIQGNTVGLNASGTAALGNGGYGIDAAPSGSNVTVGGAAAGAGNVIAANGNAGVLFEVGSSGWIKGNRIGTDATGTNSIGGNGAAVYLAASNVQVGGVLPGEGNVISGSNTNGVIVAGAATGDAILGNAIFGNAGLGIDLGNDGVTANDAGDADSGANRLQNLPVLTLAGTNGSSQFLAKGSLDSAAGSHYRIEFFANPTGDASGHGEGQRYLGFVNVTTDGSGHADFSTMLNSGVARGEAISATATLADAAFAAFTDTSEFAANLAAAALAPQDLVMVPGVAAGNLIGYYGFSDASALGHDDAAGAPITLSGSPAQTPGRDGSGALGLAGGASGQHGDIVGITTGGAMTISASVRFDSTGNWQRVVDFGEVNSTGVGNIYVGRFAGSSDLTFTLEKDLGGGNYATYRATAAGAIVNGQWLSFTATVDAAGQMALYIDGALVATRAGVAPDVAVRSHNYVGLSNWAADAPFAGAIDNLLIAQGALSAAQVAALYQQSGLSVPENSANGTVVGTVVSLDPDATHTPTYTLTDDAGGRFAIDPVTGTVTVANGSLLDFEAASSHAITVRATNNDGLWREEACTVALTDVNDAPVITSNGGGANASVSVAETLCAVTTVTATDQDGDTPTFSLVAGGDAALFQIDAGTGALSFITAPDFEAPADANGDNVYQFAVQASDGRGGVTVQSLSVTVTDVSSQLVVTTVADTNDTGLGAAFTAEQLNASRGTDGAVSLREALIAANATAGADTISFAIGSGAQTIALAASLPTIADTLTLDGTTQPGVAGAPGIVLDGGQVAAVGLELGAGADGSTLRGLVLRGFAGDAVRIHAGSSGNTVAGNYIGAFAADGTALGAAARNGGSGVSVAGDHNTIGGAGADRNLISGNQSDGVHLFGAGATDNAVLNNRIGVGASGTTALGNGAQGIFIGGGAVRNTVGAAGVGNVISGNAGAGLWLGADQTTVQGNLIGLAANGAAALGNGGAGVLVTSAGNRIGGPAAGEGNVISGNGDNGIFLTGAGLTGNRIEGNVIGTNAAGSAALGNARDGIWVNTGVTATTITGNLISGNAGRGVYLKDGGNSVTGNIIGLDASGTVALGNAVGVSIVSSGNTIGGTAVGAGNLIGGNFGAGVSITSATAYGNTIVGNRFRANGGLAIDLGGDGVTANDAGDTDDGANHLQNTPVLTEVRTDGGGQVVVRGSIDGAANVNLRIEFFSSASGDASGHGPGERVIGFVNVTTDGAGHADFTAVLSAPVAAGESVSATATLADAAFAVFTDTSEFSANATAAIPNRAPAGSNATVSAIEDTVRVFTLVDFGFSDADGNAFTAVSITTLPGLGALRRNGTLVNAGDLVTASDIALGLLTWAPPADANGAALTSFTFQVHDDGGTALGGADVDPTPNTITIDVASVNDAPVSTLPATMSFAEDSTTVLTGLAITDVDAGTSLLRTELTVSSGTLSATSGGGVVVSGSGSGTLALTGTLADLNAYLASGAAPAYTGAANATGAVTLTMSTSDGQNKGTGGMLSAGRFDYRFQDGTPAGSNPDAVAATGGVTGVATNFSVTTLANTLSGSSLGFGVIYTGALDIVTAGSYTFTVNADDAAILRIDGIALPLAWFGASSGSLTLAAGRHDFELRYAQDTGGAGLGVTYAGPDTGAAATPLVSAPNAGRIVSTPAASTITLTPVNDPPTVVTSGGSVTYNEDAPALPVDPGLAVGDIDSATLAGATVRISASYLPGEDVLGFTDQLGITGNWDVNTGTLTLTGNASVADYQTALRSVTYRDTSQSPSAGFLTVEFVVNDGSANSVAATSQVQIVSINDAPTTNDATASGNEDAASIDVTLTGSDVDGTVASFQLLSLPAQGTLYLDAGLTVVATTGVDYAASAQALTLHFVPAANWNGSTGFTFVARDGAGLAGVTPATATLTVAPVNDAPTGLPVVTGTATEDQTLSVDVSGIADADGLGSFSVQWLRDGAVVAGATGASYTPGDADVGAQLSVRVGYTDGQGTAESLTSAPTAPVANVNDAPTGLPVVTGTATEGQTLAADMAGIADADGLGSFNFQWLRNGVALSGATGAAYTLGNADVGAQISVQVGYVDGHGTAESLTSTPTAAVVNVNDAPTGLPVVTGAATEGQTLAADVAGIADADGLGSFSFQWLRNGVALSGATGAAYTLGNADVGAQISVQVGYVDGHGTAESLTSAPTAAVANVNDPPTGLPVVAGSATEDHTLSADLSGVADADGLGSFSYQWLRDGAAVAGATGATYTLGDADVGSQVSVQVGYTDGHGTAESLTSTQTAAVANVNDLPTGLPAITGTATEDQTLSADVSAVGDADGLGSFSYQWLRNGGAVAGATGATYTLGDADVGMQISVRVGYVDGHGTTESLTSAPTAAVVNVNDAPTGQPVITGTATDRQTLGLDLSGIADADGLGAFSVQWLRNGIAVSGATAATYQLGNADVGAQISVQVDYTDGHGTAESLTSAPTAAVANVNDAPTGLPGITGSATEDQTLTADVTAIADADGLGPFSYAWLRDGVAVTGANAPTYTLGDADVGARIAVRVSYTDAHGTPEALTSAATAPVANVNDAPTGTLGLAGTPVTGLTLAADTARLADADGLGSFTYTWLRNGAPIDGATGATYRLVGADEGQSISVRTSYQDGHGTVETLTSAALTARAPDAPANGGGTAPADPPAPAPTDPRAAGDPAAAGTTVQVAIPARPTPAAERGAARELGVDAPTVAVAVSEPAPSRQTVPTAAAPSKTAAAATAPRRDAAADYLDLQTRIAAVEFDPGGFALQDLLLTDAGSGRSGFQASNGNVGPAAQSDAGDDGRIGLSWNQTAAASSLALTAGTVWWALRTGGLLTSLMMSMPAWRHADLLAVLPDDEDADTWDLPEDDQARRDEDAVGDVFDAAAAPGADSELPT